MQSPAEVVHLLALDFHLLLLRGQCFAQLLDFFGGDGFAWSFMACPNMVLENRIKIRECFTRVSPHVSEFRMHSLRYIARRNQRSDRRLSRNKIIK